MCWIVMEEGSMQMSNANANNFLQLHLESKGQRCMKDELIVTHAQSVSTVSSIKGKGLIYEQLFIRYMYVVLRPLCLK